jgi:hypothetical protein
MADDKRIAELPELLIINGELYLAIYSPATDITYKIKLSAIFPVEVNSFAWDAGNAPYALDDITVHDDQLWISQIGGNNSMPGTDANWIVGVKSTGSSLKYYAPGIYTESDVYVVNSVSGQLGLYRLDPVQVRPFSSTNFTTELAAGKWISLAQRNYFRGTYVSFAALSAALVTGEPGDHADVDTGVGDDVIRYIWDDNDGVWIAGGSGGITANASETVAGIVEEATDVQTQAGTAVGETGAKLFTGPAKLAAWWTWVKTQAQTIAAVWQVPTAAVGTNTAQAASTEFVQQETVPFDSTGSVIFFDRVRTYGSAASPITATTLTEDNTGSKKVVQKIYHQAASFTPPATWQKLSSSLSYLGGSLNVIYVEHVTNTLKEYTIVRYS